MKITGEIKGNEIFANSETIELINELLNNKEFYKFIDRSASFEEIAFLIEKYRSEIIFLQEQNLNILAKMENEKTRNKKWFRFFEVAILFITFALVLIKTL